MVVSGRSFASTQRNLPDAATCCLVIFVASDFWKTGKSSWVAVLRTPPNFPARCFRHARQARGVFSAHSLKPSRMFAVHPPKPVIRDVSGTPSKTSRLGCLRHTLLSHSGCFWYTLQDHSVDACPVSAASIRLD
jgi:hypothetical protein